MWLLESDATLAKTTTMRMERSKHMYSLQARGRGHNASYFILCVLLHIWSACVNQFRMNFDLTSIVNIQQRTQLHMIASMPLPRLILIASICWNDIWRKRNNWIFNNIAHTLATGLACIYFDVIFCTGYLSEGEGDADPRDSREVVAGISSRPLGNHNTARDSKDTHLHWIGS